MDETKKNEEGIIQLYDGWLVLVDEKQWMLAKGNGEFWKKTKKPRYRIQGYYARLRTALKACCEANIHTALQHGTHSLSQAITIIEEEHKRMEKFISENVPDVR